MNRDETLALYDRQERIEAEFPGMRREATPETVRHASTIGGGSFVLYSRLDGANVDRVIEREVAHFSALNLRFEWKLYGHDTPPDLAARLLARGFVTEEMEAVLVLDLESALATIARPCALEVRRLTSPRQLSEIVALEQEVWRKDRSWLARQLGEEMRTAPATLSVFGAYADGTMVAAGWLRMPPRSAFASIWGGATLPAYRGRGCYTALLAARVADARRREYRYLQVDAGSMSRPILERRGFELLTTAQAFNWIRPADHSGSK